jgi:hypothetical protein
MSIRCVFEEVVYLTLYMIWEHARHDPIADLQHRPYNIEKP